MLSAKAEGGNLLVRIWRDNPGWKIGAERLMKGEWCLVNDRWEEKLSDIPRYVSQFTNESLDWRSDEGGLMTLKEFVAKYGEFDH